MSIGICLGSSKYDSDDSGGFWTIMEQSENIKNLTKTLQRYEEQENTIQKLTGLKFDDLIRLFAAGYTLKRPTYANLSEGLNTPKKG